MHRKSFEESLNAKSYHDAADVISELLVRSPLVLPGTKQAGVGGYHQVAQAAVFHLQLCQPSLQDLCLLSG